MKCPEMSSRLLPIFPELTDAESTQLFADVQAEMLDTDPE